MPLSTPPPKPPQQAIPFRYLSNANFSDSSWSEALMASIAFFLQPIAMPILIISSKFLKRPTKAFKITQPPIPVVKVQRNPHMTPVPAKGGYVPGVGNQPDVRKQGAMMPKKDIFDKMKDVEKDKNESSNKS